MKWSQLKKRIEVMFADAVKDRVELHTTRYHKAHDQMGRAWITFDGKEIINLCSFAAEVGLYKEAKRLREEGGCTDWTNPDERAGYYRAYDEADALRRNQGLFARPEFHQALFNYLNLSVDQILASPDPMIRAVGMLDKRVGWRRLKVLNMSDEHPLVQRLHQVRCEAETAMTEKSEMRWNI